MTTQPHRTILELIRGAVARGAAAGTQDRAYLVLEDLLDDPIEWSLCDSTCEGTQRLTTAGKVFSLH